MHIVDVGASIVPNGAFTAKKLFEKMTAFRAVNTGHSEDHSRKIGREVSLLNFMLGLGKNPAGETVRFRRTVFGNPGPVVLRVDAGAAGVKISGSGISLKPMQDVSRAFKVDLAVLVGSTFSRGDDVYHSFERRFNSGEIRGLSYVRLDEFDAGGGKLGRSRIAAPDSKNLVTRGGQARPKSQANIP